MLQAGTILDDHYRVEAAIGRGGFGYVYRAQDTLLLAKVAIKELWPVLAADEMMVRRFLAGGKATMRLAHEQIVRAFHVFPEGDSYYLVMEYMAGGSLEAWLQEQGSLPVADAVRIASEICGGLSYAHAQGVIHCDLKPSNILLTEDGSAKVAGFEIAHLSEEILSRTWDTQPGFVAGTLGYMSPEQTDGVRDDPRVDVYALGAVLYRMLAGQTYLAFDPSGTPLATVDNVLHIRNDQPQPPSAHHRQVPEWLDDVVLKALAKKPENRFSSVDALQAALARGQQAYLPTLPAPRPEFKRVGPEIEATPNGSEITRLGSGRRPLQPDDTLLNGHYRIVSQPWEGGFGFVYRAEDTQLHEEVAVKELMPRHAGNEIMLRRFLAEANATMHLSHDRIVRTHHVFAEQDSYYIVMEYLPGGSLEERLEEEGPIPVPEAVSIALEVCQGLRYAHGRGVVHCDLKPANVLFTARDGGRASAKVADFGIAHVSEGLFSPILIIPEGFAGGTLSYMAPEQLDGVRHDSRVDVYALGAMLYRMLTGRTYLDFDPRHTPGAQTDNMLRIRNEQPLPPSVHNPNIPAWLDVVVLRALSKKPDARYANMNELRLALMRQQLPEALTQPKTGIEPLELDPSLEVVPLRPLAGPPPYDGKAGRLPDWFWTAMAGVATLLVILGVIAVLLLGGANPGGGLPTAEPTPGAVVAAKDTRLPEPTDTPAPAPPTSTPGPTNSPLPPTPLPTETPLPPTATPVPTVTPVPPTATLSPAEAAQEPWRLVAEGMGHIDAQDWDAARETFDLVLRLDPGNPQAHSALAYTYAQQGSLEDAVAEYLVVIELLPEDYIAHRNLAILYQQQEDVERAIAAAERALGLAPEDEREVLQQFLESLRQLQGASATPS